MTPLVNTRPFNVVQQFIGSAFNNGSSYQPMELDSDSLDGTRFIIVYNAITPGTGVRAVVATVSGGSISYGTEVAVDGILARHSRVVAFDGSNAAAIYCPQQATAPVYATPLSITGTTITVGSRIEVSVNGQSRAVNAQTHRAARVSSSRMVVQWADNEVGDGTTGCRMQLVDLSTGSLSNAGSSIQTITGGVGENHSIMALNSTKLISSYVDGNTSGLARVVTISGSTLTAQTQFTFFNSLTNNNDRARHHLLTPVDANTALVTYWRDNLGTAPPNNEVHVTKITESSNNLSFSNTVVVEDLNPTTGSQFYPRMVALSTSDALIVNDGVVGGGNSRVYQLDISGADPSVTTTDTSMADRDPSSHGLSKISATQGVLFSAQPATNGVDGRIITL